MSKRMNRALKGLKDTYPSPDPSREKAFIDSLPQREAKPVSMPLLHIGKKPLWYAIPTVTAAVLMVAAGIGLYQHVGKHEIPSIPESTETATSGLEAGSFTEQYTEPQENTEELSETTQNSQISPAFEPTEGDTGQGSTSPAATEKPGKNTDSNEKPAPATQSATESGAASPTAPTEPELAEPTDEALLDEEPTYEREKSPMQDPIEETSDYPVDPAEPIIPIPFDPTKDDRVSPYYNYQLHDPILYEEPIEEGLGGTMPDEVHELIDQSEAIVLANVNKVWYTKVGQAAYTQLDLNVLSVYKGSYAVNDLFSVYEPGGYMPLREYLSYHTGQRDNYDSTEGTILCRGIHTQEQDVFVFFLQRATADGIPDGAYVYTNAPEQSRYSIDKGMLWDANGQTLLAESELIHVLS